MSGSLPKTYKAAVCEEVGKPLVIKDIPMKEPVEGEVLIATEACGVCHSDSVVVEGMMGGTPRVPGHEIIGKIVALGKGTESKGFKVGDRVGSGWHGGHDGICASCSRGLFQTCKAATINGVVRDGGYAEYCHLRVEALCRIPDDLDAAEAAPLLCAGVTVFNGMRNVNVRAGGTVAIQALGGLGHLAVQYSRKMGYRTVVLSRGQDKKKFAFELGAHDYIDTEAEKASEALQKIGGADLVVVTAPNPKPIPDLVEGLAVGGTLLLIAVLGPVEIPSVTMITKSLNVRGWPSGHALDCAETIDFSRRNDVNCLIEKFPLEKAQEAYEYMMAGKPRFRAVLTMK